MAVRLLSGIFLGALLLSQPTLCILSEENLALDNFTFNTIDIEYVPAVFYLNDSDSNATLAPIRKRISYFVRDGLAIVEGDYILSTEEDVLAARVDQSDETEVSKKKRSLSIFPAAPLVNLRKWPDGRFLYKWSNEEAKTQRGPAFEAAIKLWSDRVPSIKFEEVTPPSEEPTAGGAITLFSVNDRISSSPIGRAMDIQGTTFMPEGNKMILGNCPTLDSCATLYAHEIGHSLGLMHEHKRPDRDAYMTLRCENIRDITCVDGSGNPITIKALCGSGSACDGIGCQFSTVHPLEWYWAGAYDLRSIMHYYPFTFAKDPRVPVLEAKSGFVIDPASAPTLTDARRVCDIYWEVCRGVCGDGILSPNNGEECDDGNLVNGDGCNSKCEREPVCGDNVMERGEECDDGNLVDGDGCSSKCKREFCGDGIIQPGLGEECDNGNINGFVAGHCDAACKLPCLATCDPTAGKNLCSPSTSCIRLANAVGPNAGKHMCACAHGFRATGFHPKDPSRQFRAPRSRWPDQADRVFVQPGIECGQVCDQWTLGRDPCDEVLAREQCF